MSRGGILIGSAFGGFTSFADAVEALTVSGHRKMNPFCIPFAITNMGGAMLAMDVGLMGPNYPINTACATGNYCIWTAAETIRRGEADLMLAGGAEAAIIPSGIGGFIACKALSKRNDEPHRASRPWDKNRDGFVMGEGAGVLVLEELEHAQRRGAPILAEYVGGAFTSDAYHMTDPHPEGRGVKACIEKAIRMSGISASDVNYINAHATSTQAGDMAEYRAIMGALPGAKKINSTKSMIGHLLGAAGAVEAVATVKALNTGLIHPNLNIENPGACIFRFARMASAVRLTALATRRGRGGYERAGRGQEGEVGHQRGPLQLVRLWWPQQLHHVQEIPVAAVQCCSCA